MNIISKNRYFMKTATILLAVCLIAIASTQIYAATPISQSGWSLWLVDSERPGYPAVNAFDGSTYTMWQTATNGVHPHPHEIQIDLGASYDVEGLQYTGQPLFYGEKACLIFMF